MLIWTEICEQMNKKKVCNAYITPKKKQPLGYTNPLRYTKRTQSLARFQNWQQNLMLFDCSFFLCYQHTKSPRTELLLLFITDSYNPPRFRYQ